MVNSMSSWILSMKVVLISAGVVSLATALKFAVPIAVSGAPAAWSIVLAWLRPPYLYLIINGIIITIAVSSRFHHQGQSAAEPSSPSAAVRSHHLISVKTPPPSIYAPFTSQSDVINTTLEEPAPEPSEVVVSEIEDSSTVVELKPVIVNGSIVDAETDEDQLVVSNEADDVFIESSFTYNNALPRQEMISPEVQLHFLLPAREKPLVSSRFGHRKPNRSSPEGVRALRVARPKKQETLESTWKMITEGRHVPITRHLKKSDTWEHHADPAPDHVTKSETFKDRSNYEPPVRIKKEASLGQDELNRRVEAFINKFNEEMRMQRQESLNQYNEMINGGV